MSTKCPGKLSEALWNAEVDWDTHAIHALLYGTGLAFDPDTDKYLGDITGELAGTNYTAGGVALTTKTAVYDAATGQFVLSSDPAAFTNITVAGIRYVVIADRNAGSNATRPIIAVHDLGTTLSKTAEDFTPTPGDLGWLYEVTPSAA